MTKYIKVIAWGIVAIILVGAGIAVYNYLNPNIQTTTITTFADTTIAPIENIEFRPHSVPILEANKKPPVVLPPSLSPLDIDRAIVITKKTNPKDTTTIFLGKDGQYYIPNQSGLVDKVQIYTFLPPILQWDLFVRIGINGNDKKISPVINIAILRICGKLDIPTVGLDIHGINYGAEYILFEPISIGLYQHLNWDSSKEIRLTLTYNL